MVAKNEWLMMSHAEVVDTLKDFYLRGKQCISTPETEFDAAAHIILGEYPSTYDKMFNNLKVREHWVC